MKNIVRFLGIAAVLFATAFMVTSCEKKSETQKALEKGAEDAEKNAEKAVEKAEKEAGKALDKADKEAAKAIDNLTK